MAEKRQRYDAEFREGAVRIVTETGKTIGEVAKAKRLATSRNVSPETPSRAAITPWGPPRPPRYPAQAVPARA
ncbi:transposase [Streptomyces sp. NPDC005507]|uniref:transposase n=1 Tax=Streptomyces sp. NPDC005507 TaxID=3154885 RepID=UPI0033B08B10